jgi:hypothetical protein
MLDSCNNNCAGFFARDYMAFYSLVCSFCLVERLARALCKRKTSRRTGYKQQVYK